MLPLQPTSAPSHRRMSALERMKLEAALDMTRLGCDLRMDPHDTSFIGGGVSLDERDEEAMIDAVKAVPTHY